jgi:hypothetical protein
MRLIALQVDDQALDLLRQLVGIAHRPPRAVGESEQAVLSVSTVDLVTCLAGYTEFPGTYRTLIRRPAGGRRNDGALPLPREVIAARLTPPAALLLGTPSQKGPALCLPAQLRTRRRLVCPRCAP